MSAEPKQHTGKLKRSLLILSTTSKQAIPTYGILSRLIMLLSSVFKVWKWKKKISQTKQTNLFQQAWNDATNDFEKFLAAHYIARHQKSVSDQLHWLETALQLH